MKRWISFAILFLSSPAWSLVGNGGPSGGDPKAVEFMLIADKVCSWAKNSLAQTYPEISNCPEIVQDLRASLNGPQKARLAFTDKKLYDQGVSKFAVFKRATKSITVNRQHWDASTLQEKYTMVGLEIAGLSGVGKRYDIGEQIDAHFYQIKGPGETKKASQKEERTSPGDGVNLIQNPGFEESFSLEPFWVLHGHPSRSGVDVASPAHSAAHSGKNNGYIWDGSKRKKNFDLSQAVKLKAHTKYLFTAWVIANNTKDGQLGIRNLEGARIAATSFANNNPDARTEPSNYQQYTVAFNSEENESVVVFIGYSTIEGSSSYINLDDAVLSPAP